MFDLEVLNHAKSYINLLANGVNPLTGEVVEEDTTLNHVRLSRCFFFVSEVLEEVISNGGVVGGGPVVEKKMKFTITEQEIARVPISNSPIGITDFCDIITNTVGNHKMTRLQTTKVTDWLENKGFLQSKLDHDGKNKKVPTDMASQIGITQEKRTSEKFGEYDVNVYHPIGQQFILDHLQEMLVTDSTKILKENNTVLTNRVYRHFKGKLYYVHDLVIHTETEEEMVSYQALYPPYGMFVRPKKMFLEKVPLDREGNLLGQSKRFELFHPILDV